MHSDFARFAARFCIKIVLFGVVCVIIFFIQLPRHYYLDLVGSSAHSKIRWNDAKLNSMSSLDSATIFLGSSICMNGINDSLLNTWNGSKDKYINMGISGPCYALESSFIADILERRKLRPERVLLCFKGDAFGSQIHCMYAIVAKTREIIESIRFGNTHYLANIFQRIAWNLNFVTRHLKFHSGGEKSIENSPFGFVAKKPKDSIIVENLYASVKTDTEMNLNALKLRSEGQELPWKSRIYVTIIDVIKNYHFQRNMFARMTEHLDKHSIPYDILIYPNLVSARLNQSEIMANYIKHTFKAIDYSKHRVIAANDTAFGNSRYYVDMNHLNARGAELYTHCIYNELH